MQKPNGVIPRPDATYVVPPGEPRQLDHTLKTLAKSSWNDARAQIETGKVQVNGRRLLDPRTKVQPGATIEVFLRAPRPEVERVLAVEKDLFVYVDAHVAVVRKPAGISTVPFADEDPRATFDAVVRDALARKARAEGRAMTGRAPLGVVQRLDKMTSGVMVFARNVTAKQALSALLRVHDVHRVYLAIVHGAFRQARTLESHLTEDRGDGLRGSTELAARRGRRGLTGQRAITHVEPVEQLEGATLVRCQLQTGRTHQIRIHLAEEGHPLVGEQVYVRDYPLERIDAPRLMLHAAELGVEHPATEKPMFFAEPPPADFQKVLAKLRAK